MSKVATDKDISPKSEPVAVNASSASANGPEHQHFDLLQTLADQSAMVKRTEKTGEIANEESTFAKVGAGSKMMSAGTGIAAAATSDSAVENINHAGNHDDWGISNDFMVGIQKTTQVIYSVQDAIDKKDNKSIMAAVLDMTNGLFELEKKLHVAGVSEEVFPIIGGAITGLRQLLNARRVSESMETLNTISAKPVFSEEDKNIINEFKKEQQISLIKHSMQSVIGFASMASPLLGPIGPVAFSALQAMIPLVATIRDKWINYVESTTNKAKKRLGVDQGVDGATSDLSIVQDLMVQESKNNALLSADLVPEDELTADKFSIRKLMETYNILQSSKENLKSKDPKDDDYSNAETHVKNIEQGLDAAIIEYNDEMGRMTNTYFKQSFKPITINTVQKLHDYHIQCIHNIMVQAKEREQKLQEAASFLRLFMKTEEKQAILVELYDGKVPEKTDIKLAEMTAETQDYFWEKTQKAIGDAVKEVQMSKATLVAKMNKIMKKNKNAILKNMYGDGKFFQSEKEFDSDVKAVISTLDL